MGMIRTICTILLGCTLLLNSANAVQGPAQEKRATSIERWQSMTEEERVEMKKRFESLRLMTPEQRAELKHRAKDLIKERDGLVRKLGPKFQDRLKGLAPHERNHVLREHQLGERRRAGRSLRKNLDSKNATWVDGMIGPGMPRPFHELRAEIRGKVEGHVLDRMGDRGDLTGEERQRIEGLSPKKRMSAMLELHRKRIEAVIARDGLPEGVDPAAWSALQSEDKPERFLGGAHKLGLGALAPRPFDPLMSALAELLRPSFEDRLSVADLPRRKQREMLDGRLAKQLREKLADKAWFPDLNRSKFEGLGDGALLRKLRKLIGAPPREGQPRKRRFPGPPR